MPYIGNQPGTGVRNRFIYTATASQTTFSGADDNGKTLKYADSDFVDVFLNGICLVPVTDYTSTSKTSIVLTQAASLNDTLEVVAYDIATISDTVSKADGGTFDGNVGFGTAPERQVHIAGNPAIMLMEDTGGGTNDKRAQIQVDSGAFEINSRNDDNSSLKDNILVAELDTGNIGLGINTPSSMLHLFDGGTDTGITLQSKVQASATSSITFMSRDSSNVNQSAVLKNIDGRFQSSAGIMFGSDTSADNALDDYEEGTWTPSIYYQNADDNSNKNHDEQVGFYTKVGRWVHISCHLKWDATDARANDNIGVTGIPFNSASLNNEVTYQAPIYAVSTSLSASAFTPIALLGDNSGTILILTSTGGGNLGDNFGQNNNMVLRFNLSYFT